MEKLFQVYVWRRGRWVWHSELTNKIRHVSEEIFCVLQIGRGSGDQTEAKPNVRVSEKLQSRT